MRWMRCLGELAIRGDDFGRRLGPGALIDFDEQLAPGYRVAEALKGRETCFEPVEPSAPSFEGLPADEPVES